MEKNKGRKLLKILRIVILKLTFFLLKPCGDGLDFKFQQSSENISARYSYIFSLVTEKIFAGNPKRMKKGKPNPL